MSTQSGAGQTGEAFRVWRSSGFAAAFTLLLGAVVLWFYFDDQTSIASLNTQLSIQREQRDREIISTNRDITVLQDELRHVQGALLGNEHALTLTQQRLEAVMAAYEHHSPVPPAPSDYEPAKPLTPVEKAALAQNLDSIKSIAATIQANEEAFRSAAKALMEIRRAMVAGRPPNATKTDPAGWSRAQIELANAALQSQLDTLDHRRDGEGKEGAYVPRDLSMATFMVGVENAELTEIQHQLLAVQADLGAAQREFASERKSAAATK